MSSYIVENKTIDRIISVMKLMKNKEVNRLLTDDKTAFGHKLLDMNISAVDQRYDETNDKIEYSFNECRVSKIQGLKSIRGFLYQCMEGDVPETDLYNKMRSVSDSLAHSIVEDMPAYDKAEWA